MTDQFDPTMRNQQPGGESGGAQAGMDPEGLMPADETLHGDEAGRTEASTAAERGGLDMSAVSQLLTEPHDQPVEGGVEQAEDPGGSDRR